MDYDDSAREGLKGLKTWLQGRGFSRAVAAVLLQNEKGGGGRVETYSVAQEPDWPSLDDDCALFQSALDLLKNGPGVTLAFDPALTDWAHTLGPAFALVIVHKLPTIVIFSSIKDGPGTADYRELLEMAVATMRHPDEVVPPEQ